MAASVSLKRQSNIELCRLVSILLVMLLHTTNESLGDNMSFGALLLEGFTIIGVNVFILITGYFSATPKKTSLFNLAFICFFWMILTVVCRIICGEAVSYKYLFFITSSNWFIVSYIGLIFLAPIINIFSNSVSKRTIWGGAFLLLLVVMWFDWLPPYPSVRIGANGGYSTLSFAIIYLIGRAIRLHGLPKLFMKYSMFIYLICSLFLGVIAKLLLETGHIGASRLCFAYICPIVIVSSIAFFSYFEKLSFKSAFINHIAKSTLAVLLGHSAIFFLYTKQFKFLYENFKGVEVVMYWIIAVAIVFGLSIIVDQLRQLLYKPISDTLERRIKNDVIIDISN